MDNQAAHSGLHLVNNDPDLLNSQARIIEAIHDSEKADPSIWISKRGIKFQLKLISSRIGMEVAKSIDMPKIPTFTDDEGRVRENPIDPTYLDERQQALINKGLLVMQANIGLGTKIISVPAGVQSVNDTEWSDELDTITNGVIKIPAGGMPRYLAWINYYALVGSESSDLNTAVLRYSGVVTEVDVESASENFQSDEARDTDEGVPPTTED